MKNVKCKMLFIAFTNIFFTKSKSENNKKILSNKTKISRKYLKIISKKISP